MQNISSLYSEMASFSSNGESSALEVYYKTLGKQVQALIEKPLSDQTVIDDLLQTSDLKERTNNALEKRKEALAL